MNGKAFKKALQTIPDDFEVQIWDTQDEEWKDNLTGLLQAVRVLTDEE